MSDSQSDPPFPPGEAPSRTGITLEAASIDTQTTPRTFGSSRLAFMGGRVRAIVSYGRPDTSVEAPLQDRRV